MNNQVKSITLKWIGPGVIFVIVLVIMLFNFANKSQLNANNIVNRNLMTSAEICARKFNEDITLLEKVGKPIAEILSHSMEQKTLDQDLSYEVELLEVAVSHSGAYTAYICDENGNAINNEGNKSSIREKDYFDDLIEEEGISYLYTYDDGEGLDAVIVSVPILSEGKNKLDLVLFYSLKNISKMVKKFDFNLWSIETIMDSDGNVIASYGNYGYWKQGDNLFEVLQSYNSELVKDIENHIVRGTTTVGQIDEYNSLVYTPFDAGEWSVVFGVSQSYIDKQVEQQWVTSRNLVNQLAIALCIFILFAVAVLIASKIYNVRKQQQLESKADTDLLTGLNNKLATERKIKEFIAGNPNAQSMMFIFDIDNFKKINDTMGHAFGDEVLRSLGQQIRVLFRSSDIVGRAGGDEFIVFLKNINEPEIVRKEAKKVEDFFKDFKAGEYTKYSATASIGVAIFPQEGADFESLYKAADSALYKAKQRGKKQLAFYNDKWLG
ncbi:MAG: GGDEF domain-containing protein [Lachnospiraceae bacterium]|nr:GGDEF domain-containing protein [Lachnospiraceae bacterium]